MDTTDYTNGVETTDTFDIWRRKTNQIITKISSGSNGANPVDGYPTWKANGDFTISGTGTLNAKDIYCRNIYSGSGTGTDDSVIELGQTRTGNGKAILDFHTSVNSDFDARIKKEGTVNGQFSFENNGTGTFLFNQADVTAPFIFSHAQNERLKITNAGVTIGTISQPKPLTVEGDIIGKANIQNAKIRIGDNDIYEYATDAETTLSINRNGYLGGTTRFRNTIIYDGKGVELVSFNGNAKTVTIGNGITCSLTVKGSITGESVSAGSSGTISGGTVTCTSLTTQNGAISCGDINTSGIYTQTGKIKPATFNGGITTFDIYSDGGIIGIGEGGTITASIDKIGAITSTSITSSGQISGNTFRTSSKIKFGWGDLGVPRQNTDIIEIERVDVDVDVTELRVAIGDNPSTARDAFVVGVYPTPTVDWVEKFRVDSGGNVESAGSITAGTTLKAKGDVIAYSTSDRKYKNNIKNITDPLGKVSQINGVSFDWNDKQTVFSGHDIGVIAQDVEAVLPEIVTTRDDGSKAVKYDKLVALLIECVKELKSEIEELKLSIK